MSTTLATRTDIAIGPDGTTRDRSGHHGGPRLTAAAALGAVAEGMLIFNQRGRVRVCNDAMSALLGVPLADCHSSTSLARTLGAATRLEPGDADRLLRLADAAIRDSLPRSDIVRLRDGLVRSVTVRRIADGAWAFIMTAPEADAARATSQDALTGLADRAAFRERLADALNQNAACTVLVIDLDRFQAVNDTYGHTTGDLLLRAVADRLRTMLSTNDLIARLSADQFAALLPRETTAQSAVVVARRMLDVIGHPYVIHGIEIMVGASVGLALAPRDGDMADALLGNADFALRQAKAAGRGTYRAFDAEVSARARARHVMAGDLHRAVLAGEFVLNYQPQLKLSDRRLVGFEALIRWNHPRDGLIQPDNFIPLSEETGLIEPIGEWVLRTACREAARWPDPLTVAVNVSAIQFADGRRLVRAVRDALAASGLPGHRLDIEITESVLLNAASAHKTLAALREEGVRISMDDFGTGYSSLGQLRSFPFNKIKIDRCFIRDIESSAEAMAIIRAIGVLGPSLGMSTTVEGVETETQARLVRNLGCTDMQGYFISRPVPATAVPGLIASLTHRPAKNVTGGGA